MDERRGDECRRSASDRMVDGDTRHLHRGEVLWTGGYTGREPSWVFSGGWVPGGKGEAHRNRNGGNLEVDDREPFECHESSSMLVNMHGNSRRAQSTPCKKSEIAAGWGSPVGGQLEIGRGRASTFESSTRRGCRIQGSREEKKREGFQRQEKTEKRRQERQGQSEKEEGKEGEDYLLSSKGRSRSRSHGGRGAWHFELEQQPQGKEVQGERKEGPAGHLLMHGIGPPEEDKSQGAQKDSEENQKESKVVDEFLRGEYIRYIQHQGGRDLRGVSPRQKDCSGGTGGFGLESTRRYERAASEQTGGTLRRIAGWSDTFVPPLLPTGAGPQGDWRSSSRSSQSSVFARFDPERPGGPCGGCWLPEVEGFRTGCERPQLVNHSETRASAAGARATSLAPGDERSSKRAMGRMASSESCASKLGFLDKVRQGRSTKRRWSPKGKNQGEVQREGEVDQGRRKGREEMRSRDEEESALREAYGAVAEEKGSEKGDGISLVAVEGSLKKSCGSEIACRNAACTESEMQPSSIGAVLDRVRHHTALSEKELENFEGRSFGECVPGLVLGLSDLHDEFCKTLPTGDEIFPLPLDTPWTLPEVQETPIDVQRILLGLICGLNSLNGQGIRWEGTLSATRKRILLNLLDEAKRFQDFGHQIELGVSCWADFLKVRSIDYKGDEVQVAQYTTWANLAPALPDEIGTVKLEDVMEDGSKHYALHFEDFLVPSDAQEYTRPPRVMIADEDWLEVCQGLLSKGVCGLLRASEVFHVNKKPLLNGLFGVSKNDQANGIEIHRLIMNLIPLNKLCRSFEGDVGTLPAWPSMAPLCLQPTEDLLISSEDVKCFFYIFETPVTWRPYMAFNKIVPPELCGDSAEPMYLCAKVLPMGFRNSVSLAQHIHRWIVAQSMRDQSGTTTGLGGHAEHRRDRPFTSANPSYRIYLDNYDELEKVDTSLAKIIAGTPSVHTLALRDTYRDLNIPRHPKKSVAREFVAEVQGALVDGKQGTARPKPDKIAKYVGLAWELIKEGQASQKQLQVRSCWGFGVYDHV